MAKERQDKRQASRKDPDTASQAKPAYQAPTVLPLWDLRRGLGNCVSGPSDNVVCLAGGNNHDCYDGSSATDNCSVGTGGTAP